MSTRSSSLRNTVRFGERGISMVEIMVALVASMLLMAGVGQVFTSNKQTYRTQEALSRLQENARFATETIMRGLRDAGYMGASNSVALTNTLNMGVNQYAFTFGYGIDPADPRIDPRLNTIKAIEGLDWSGDTWVPPRNNNIVSSSRLVQGSDILTVRGPVGTPATLAQNAGAADNLVVNSPNGLSPCNLVIVSDFDKATIMQITGIGNNNTTLLHAAGVPPGPCPNPGPGNSTNLLASGTPPNPLYSAGASVTPYATTVYFVRRNSNNISNAEPALYRRVNGANSEEIVEGVEGMQILYGVENDPLLNTPYTNALSPGAQYPNYGPDFYVSAAQIFNNGIDWRRVVSVRISLLMRTREDNLALTAAKFPFNDVEFPLQGSADRRLRQVFTTTISIRNRQP